MKVYDLIHRQQKSFTGTGEGFRGHGIVLKINGKTRMLTQQIFSIKILQTIYKI